MADNKIIIEVSATGNAEVVLKKVTEATKDLGTQGTASLERFSGAFNSFVGNLASNVATGAFNKLTSAAGTLFDTFIVQGVKASIEQEDALTRLAFALGQAGDASKEAVSDFDAFASRIQATTKFQDDAVLSAGALISTLTGLSGTALKNATEAAVNLSASLGIDLDTAAKKLAAGLNGPSDGLVKLGIHLDASKPKAQALAEEIDRINKGGAAAAQINTYSGAITLAEHSFGEIAETIGGVITGNQSLLSVVKAVSGIFVSLNTAVKENQGELSNLVSQGVILVIDGMIQLISIAQAASVTFLKLAAAAVQAQGVLQAFTDFATGGLTDVGKRTEESAEKFLALQNSIATLENSETISKLNEGLFSLREAAESGIGSIATNSENAQRALTGAADATARFTEEQKKLAEEGKKIAETAIESVDPEAKLEAQQEALDAAFELDMIDLTRRNEAIAVFEAQRLQTVSDSKTKEADFLAEKNRFLITDNASANAEIIAANNEKLAAILASEDLTAQDRFRIESKLRDQEKIIFESRKQAGMNALSALASFQNAKTKELAAVGKAAAIAQTTISTFQGATAGFAALAGIPIVGPALGAIAAAVIIAAGLANVARISGVNLAGGMTEVPAGFRNDTFAANLSSGERVVDANTNQDLKLFLATNNNNTALLSNILDRLDGLENTTIVNVGGRELVNEVQRQIDSGRALNV